MTLRRLAATLLAVAALAPAAPASAGELMDTYCLETPVIDLCTPPLPI